MKKQFLIILLTAVTGLIGCSHKEELVKPVSVSKPRPQVSLNADASAAPEAPLAADSSPAVADIPRKPITAEESQSILQRDEQAQNELNQALQAFQKTHGNVPSDIHELVVAKLIHSVPTPPQGGVYVIDPQAKAIVWTRQ